MKEILKCPRCSHDLEKVDEDNSYKCPNCGNKYTLKKCPKCEQYSFIHYEDRIFDVNVNENRCLREECSFFERISDISDEELKEAKECIRCGQKTVYIILKNNKYIYKCRNCGNEYSKIEKCVKYLDEDYPNPDQIRRIRRIKKNKEN